jgi:small nuclear ribonucleoprotein (snRNP)-like protein
MAQTVSTKKNVSTTLGSLLTYMEGIELIVELKTGRRFRGTLSSADDYMNLTLDDAEEQGGKPGNKKEDYSSSEGASTTELTNDNMNILTALNIRGSNIRYIHFPDNADLSSLVRTGTERERSAANKYNRGIRK